MTATLERPAPPPPAGTAAPATAPTASPARPGPTSFNAITLEVAATLGLAVYSVVAAMSFSRVFGADLFVGDVLIVVIVGHGASLLLRLARVPGVLAVLVTLVALAWTVGYLHYPSTFSNLLPGTATWDVATADLALVRDQFRAAVAPVAYVGGWALLASVGTAFVVFAGDTLAFRANGRGEALVPGAVLFVFVIALGVDDQRIGLALALVAAGVVATALLRARSTPPPRTLLGRRRNSLTTLLPAALVTGGLVMLAAWVIGPRLPGAADEPLIDTSEQGGGVTEVLSPLVDIRARLVNRSASQLFTMTATTPAYWRATALPQFDGSTWGLPDRSLVDTDGALQEPRPGAVDNVQRLVIAGLGGPLVPAAAEPIVVAGDELRWNADTSTLVRTDRSLETGDQIDIVSAVPVLSPEQLRAATSASPPEPIYLELPADFPQSVRDQAVAVVGAAPTSYDKALALQSFFRDTFIYSTEIPQGHGNDAIEGFLRNRTGYCEQFAGTFAAMARSLGIPARVAVGFTPGLPQANGSYLVLGRNAHAWPEVWFDGIGWVAFEPTPGRGAPGNESYTGVAAAQDESVPTPGEGTDDAIVAPPPTAAPTPATVPPSEIPEAQRQAASGLTPISATLSTRPVGLVVVLGLLLAGVVAVVTPEAVRRWRRRHPDPDPAVQLHHLWTRAMSAIEATGLRADPSLTPIEQARAASPRLPVAARPLKSLAEVTTQAVFSPATDVAELKIPATFAEGGPRRWCRQVERIATDSMTAAGRVRRYFTVWR